MTAAEQKRAAEELLKIHYGYSSFRPGQEKVVDNILAGRSTVVIMPTGGGKSLCYQLPALVLEGITIVISPLIALMKDQVDSLNAIGIPAAFVNSSISPAETAKRLEEARQGYFKLLYVAPERFYSREFIDALAGIKVSLFAVDEAHCISQWGHDFRPAYTRLRQAVELVGRPTVIALTATATPEVREDIVRQLGLESPEVIVTGFARPNLQFAVVPAPDARKIEIILEAVSAITEGSGIVYSGTRSKADEIVQLLLDNGTEAVVYHAGMDQEERKWVQDNFMSGKAKVVVATNAFGMGIDKSDIRFVIHYDMPGTMEAYYQEAGRAGRDGKPSYCLMLYSPRDRYLREFFIKGDNPPPGVILDVYDACLSYETDKILVTYSELKGMVSEDVPEMAIGTAVKILEREGYIRRSQEKSGNAFLQLSVGLSDIDNRIGKRAKSQRQVWEALAGRFSKELLDGWEFNPEDLATDIGIKKDSLLRFIKKMAEGGALEYRPPFKGTEIDILKKVDRAEVKLDFTALRNKLEAAQAKLDKMESYSYHYGCRQKYILDYFGDSQSRACGTCDNCKNGGRPAAYQPAAQARPKRSSDTPPRRKAFAEDFVAAPPDEEVGLGTKLPQMETYELYKKGLGIDEIAMTSNLKPATVVDHLVFLLSAGLALDLGRLVSKAKQARIAEVVGTKKGLKPAEVKEKLGDENISISEIRLVLAKKK